MPLTVQQIGKPTDGRTIGQWVKEATIGAAETALREEVAKGFDNQPVVVTDGMPRRDYHGVKPFGRIEFIRRPQMAEAVLWALDMLRKRSPVLTGRYVQSHTVLVISTARPGRSRSARSPGCGLARPSVTWPRPTSTRSVVASGCAASRRARSRSVSPRRPHWVMAKPKAASGW